MSNRAHFIFSDSQDSLIWILLTLLLFLSPIILRIYRILTLSKGGRSILLARKANRLISKNQWGKAKTLASQAVALDDENPLAHFVLGRCALQDKNPKEAKGYLEKAALLERNATEEKLGRETVNPKDVYFYKRLAEIEDDTFREGEPEKISELAAAYLQHRDVNKAIHLLRASLNEHKNSPKLLTLLGVAYTKQKRFADAKNSFQEAIQSNYGPAYFNQGLLSIRNKEWKQAQLYLEQAKALGVDRADLSEAFAVIKKTDV